MRHDEEVSPRVGVGYQAMQAVEGLKRVWACVRYQAMQAVEGLKTKGDKMAAAEQIKALYQTFVKSDCTMVEVRASIWHFI